MKDLNLFIAGTMLGFAIEEMHQRRWKAMALSLVIFAINVACAVWL